LFRNANIFSLSYSYRLVFLMPPARKKPKLLPASGAPDEKEVPGQREAEAYLGMQADLADGWIPQVLMFFAGKEMTT